MNRLLVLFAIAVGCGVSDGKGIEDFPYHASIEKVGKHVCSGAIISENVVITTASCLYGADYQQITVRVGSDQFEAKGTVKSVQKLILHKRYMTSRKDYDIALVVLGEKLVFSDAVQAIDLVPTTYNPPVQGTKGFLTGFGLGEEQYTDDVRQEEIEISVPIKCKNAYAPMFIYITERMFCAELTAKHPCHGDSGSLLVIDNELLGIQAWEHKCGTSRFPGIYTSIGNLRKWIKTSADV